MNRVKDLKLQQKIYGNNIFNASNGRFKVLEEIRKQTDAEKNFHFNQGNCRESLKGIGKPEALKHELSGFYSRRINQEHRIIYKVTNTAIRIETIKGHY